MRPLYLLLRILLPYVMSVFYRRTKTLNSQKKFNAQTIFVSNHPSAFIDPLVAGNYQMPVLYFVTRGDIFKKWLHPVTWASHMVPIFRRDQDGADSHEKNKDSFVYLRKTLLRKKSLILFGEGYTDDVFIRSLKPIKKGPARIGFDTMAASNWEEDIKIQTIGLNYTHPKEFRSDVLVAMGDCIHLKDLRTEYETNPTIAITNLTRKIQASLQDQLTYVEDKQLAPFVEQILILSRKGMNQFHSDKRIKLEDRYQYSRGVANKVNKDYATSNELKKLNEETNSYFAELKEKNINENWVANYTKTKTKSTAKTWFKAILGSSFILLGLIHQLLPYLLVKRFVEKSFKRDVFWSGVKLLVGAVFSTIYNFGFIYIFYYLIYPSYWLAMLYFLTIPVLSGIFAYHQLKAVKNAIDYKKANESDLIELGIKREKLIKSITLLKLN